MEINRIADLDPTRRRALFERDAGLSAVQSDVDAIIERVAAEGDVALREYASEFDDIEVGNLEITDQARRAADAIDTEIREAIETAAGNIRRFHEAQRPADWRRDFGPGIELGRRFRPLERVGAYVPGGTAAYPSSALMTVIPATVAGVDHVAVATPPGEPQNRVTLAAIHIAGADVVYRTGGAQAIAALAHGTETVDRVQKIVGPGNRWVTAAKAAVRGEVEIDFLAGPSELLVIADGDAEPAYVAADLIAQAEHDEDAAVVLVTDAEDVAVEIRDAIVEQTAEAPRRSVIEASISNDASGIFVGRSMSECVLFAEEFAPEHLSIQAADPDSILDRIDSAGSVFLGDHTPVAVGDYASGTNHVLPTNGRAKVTGGLSVDDFVRSSTVQRCTEAGLASLAETVITLSTAEGLDAHAASVSRRLERSED